MKRLLSPFLILLFTLGAAAQSTLVWDQPAAARWGWTSHITATRVEMTADSTVVHLHLNLWAGKEVSFTNRTAIRVGDQTYGVRSMTVMTFGETYHMPESGQLDFTMTFAPLPLGTKAFDLVFSEGFAIPNLHERHQPDGIDDTYWRHDQTGEWYIAFMPDHVVYDSRVWSIVERKVDKKGAVDLMVDCDGERLPISVGPYKKGQRAISVGRAKRVICSAIISDYLPDYPTTDPRTHLADNQYRSGDSVTIAGWLCHQPQHLAESKREFEVAYDNFFDGSERNFLARIDSLGRFSMRVPVENTTTLWLDMKRTRETLVVEPGENYFLLVDFADNKVLVMGPNARLQNEMLAHSSVLSLPDHHALMPKIGAMGFLHRCDSIYADALKHLNSQKRLHPTLSARYHTVQKAQMLTILGGELMQGRFAVNTLPDKYIDYVNDSIWQRYDVPFTLVSSTMGFFMTDYAQTMAERLRSREASFKPAPYLMDAVIRDRAWQQSVQDVYIAHTLCRYIDQERMALPDSLISYARERISQPGMLAVVEAMHNKYEALAQSPVLSTDTVSLDGQTDGASIMERILEPHRGRIVLLDVWGTWCSPCKKALAESHEEYERLKAYDVVYVYMANNSPQAAWQNVIREYGLEGPNIRHYNLPADQQDAVERYLNIRHYPSYFLFDRQGRLLDVKADPRQLNALEQTISQIP